MNSQVNSQEIRQVGSQVSSQKLYKNKYNLEKQATLLFEEKEIPLTKQEWQTLGKLLANSEFDHVIGGDAHESHSVWVSRYFNDVVSPEALNDYSKDIEAIVMSAKMRRFYQQFTGTDKLCLRRCQANRMQPGDYIGQHKDQDSSPDYYATIVFHFSSNYGGGFFLTGDDAMHQQQYKPAAHTALVNNCSISHRVTTVESGERLTLACFLSTSFASNKSKPAAFKIDKNRQLIPK